MTEGCRLDCTEHHEEYNGSRWIDAARALLHEPDERAPENLITIPGLKTKVPPYQLLGMWVELEMEEILNGGMNCDGPGLGKVSCRFCHVRGCAKDELVDSAAGCHGHQCRDNHE